MDSTKNALRLVEDSLSQAFRSVRLGGGISIRQSQVIDQRANVTRQEFDRLPRNEITDDWTKIPESELDEACVAHLDAEGFRYYIPALALSVLNRYDSSSMRVIGTLSSLYPKKDHWDFDMQRYSMLDTAQKKALAMFLRHLPSLVSLNHEDPTRVQRALRNYWAQFLSP